MPKGPQGQWQPAGAGTLAAHVCRIATGESKKPTNHLETLQGTPSQADERVTPGRPEHRHSRLRDALR